MRLKPAHLALINPNISESHDAVNHLDAPFAKLSALLVSGLIMSLSSSVMAAPAPNTDSISGAVLENAVLDEPLNTAHSTSAIAHYQQQATKQALAEHPTWRRMLYLKDKKAGDAHHKASKADISPIDNPKYFVSPNGKVSPQAELDAMLELMLMPASSSSAQLQARQAALCRFPARVHWLKEQLSLTDGQIAPYACPEFDAWMAKLDPQRLSVVFAEEYLDNPLSAFGHTLMLIDSAKSLANPADIDAAHALNDTVAGDANDNFVVYAAKSMTGKYPNEITIDPFPEKLAYYIQHDERDVWTYPLQLTQAEVQQIMRHVWETKDLGLPYYFTTDNCASEILRYIDIVRPEGSLLAKLPYVVVPSDVVRLLTKEGLISEQDQQYLPADDTLRQAKLNQAKLTPSQPDTAKLMNKSPLPTSIISANDKLLSVPIQPASNNPNSGHPLQRVMIGVGQKGDLGYGELSFRAGFNDLLDRPDGYPQHFDLEGLSASVRVYESDGNTNNSHPNDKQNQVVLQDLTLLRGRSFNPINSGRSGKNWGLNLGATRVNDGSEPSDSAHNGDHLVANATFELGQSLAFGSPRAGTGELPPQLCYALGNASAQVGKGLNNGWRAGIGVNLGCRYQVSTKLRAHAEVAVPYWYHGDIDQAADSKTDSKASGHYWQPIASLGVQYDIDRTQAVRLQGNYEFQDRVRDQDDVQIVYVRYF